MKALSKLLSTACSAFLPSFAPRTCRRACLLTAISFLLSGVSLSATTVIPPDFATLVGQADVIFSGQVISIKSEWVGQGKMRHIESNISFKVLKSLKGNLPETFVLNMLGGTVGQDTMEIVGAPEFKVGDRSILFVENNGRQIVPLVGMMHGHFRITVDSSTSEEVIHKHDGTPLRDTEEIDEIQARGGFDHPAPDSTHHNSAAKPASKPMKRSEFESAIERRLRSTQK